MLAVTALGATREAMVSLNCLTSPCKVSGAGQAEQSAAFYSLPRLWRLGKTAGADGIPLCYGGERKMPHLGGRFCIISMQGKEQR